jgi:hypothetical protein
MKCQETLSNEAKKNSGGPFCVSCDPAFDRPGVGNPGNVYPHIGQVLRYGLPLKSSGHQNRVVTGAG